MEHLSEILTIGNTALLPILGFFLFYNSRRREARAKAEREEIHNVSSISDEWQELYKKAEENWQPKMPKSTSFTRRKSPTVSESASSMSSTML